MVDKPVFGEQPIITINRKHIFVTRRLKRACVMNIKEKLHYGDANGKLHGDLLLVAKQVAAAWSGNAIWMDKVIEPIIA